MKTALAAVVGVAAVLAVAGLVMASGASTNGFSSRAGDGSGFANGHMGIGSGHMHEWWNQYQYRQSGDPDSCRMHYAWEWNYSYDYENGYPDCPCA